MELEQALVGSTPAIEHVRRMICRIAGGNSRALITGETGTGKKTVVQQIQRHSGRKDKPFIAMNCVATPEELMEVELFGSDKGAFGGASSQRQGKFEQASGGTLLLEDIENMSIHVQVKLLQALQEGRITRFGGQTPISVDSRVISTTCKSLPELTESGSFREDLYYCLNLVQIHIPPLRERLEDVPFLAEHFLSQFCVKTGRCIDKFDKSAMSALVNYYWPGNINELRNVIERAVILTDGNIVTLSNLPDGITHSSDKSGTTLSLESPSLAAAELAIIEYCLGKADGNLSKAAKTLQISRGTLYSKMMKHGIRGSEEEL